ncbi:hypothetical protein ACFGVR_14975 [Mucilaginibacter sp. AW1-3]
MLFTNLSLEAAQFLRETVKRLFSITDLTRPVPFGDRLFHGHPGQLIRTMFQPTAFVTVIGMRGLAFTNEDRVRLVDGLCADSLAATVTCGDQEK